MEDLHEDWIMWLGQGGFLLSIGKRSICIDPYLSNSLHKSKKKGFIRLLEPPMLPEQLTTNLFISTHDHLDHLDTETVTRMNSEGVLFLGPASCINLLSNLSIPQKQLIMLNAGDKIELTDFSIHGVFADHTEDSIGIVIKAGSFTLYFTGDTLYNTRLYEVKDFSPHIIFTCINGKLGNMDYKEAAQLSNSLGVCSSVPCHYGMFSENTEDPQNFKRHINCNISCNILELGIPVQIKHLLGGQMS